MENKICLPRYRLAQQQLKEMKKKGLREATQMYHVSSSPVHDTLVETSASPTSSPVPTPTGFAQSALPLGLQGDTDNSHLHVAVSFSELPTQTSRITPDRLSPRVELVLGPPISGHPSRGSSKWLDRTADWVEMVERSGLSGMGNSYHKNPNFRRTSSFNDTKPHFPSSAHSRHFRERSMTQVYTAIIMHFLSKLQCMCRSVKAFCRNEQYSYSIFFRWDLGLFLKEAVGPKE